MQSPPPPLPLLPTPPSPHTSPRPGGTLALGMLVTLASVVYAAFRAGSNTALFTLDGSEDGEGGAGGGAGQRQALLADVEVRAGRGGEVGAGAGEVGRYASAHRVGPKSQRTVGGGSGCVCVCPSTTVEAPAVTLLTRRDLAVVPLRMYACVA